MKLLTVIIPAYNVDSYIGTCIESVLKQASSHKSIRVIVVIDGATDSTFDEATLAAKGHEDSVLIVSQHNAGLSAARNAGIELTETEYVTFLDGDDIWLTGYLEATLPVLEARIADVVEYDAARITESGEHLDLLKIAAASPGENTLVTAHQFLRIFRCYAWARIYRTSLVRVHPYPVGRRFEDTATTPWHYWNSRSCISIGIPLIGYRQRAQSILAVPTRQDIDDISETTKEAATMFSKTRDTYWQHVTHRSFQQACRRTTWLPFPLWRESLRTALLAIQGVPPPAGLTRWLQVHSTFTYTILLYCKRVFESR